VAAKVLTLSYTVYSVIFIFNLILFYFLVLLLVLVSNYFLVLVSF